MEVRNWEWVYDRLLCELHHYDCCIMGIIVNDGVRQYVEAANFDQTAPLMYHVYDIEWDAECEEYLADYRKAFAHWFYASGKRACHWDGAKHEWFREKWGDRDPLREKAGLPALPACNF